jgi:hypothetical protein
MVRIAARLLAAFLAAVAIGGTGMAVASAGPAGSSRHGTEEFVLMDSSTRSLVFSVIATGLFTDGGAINIDSAKGEAKLGAGTFRVHTKTGPARQKLNSATCLRTITARGTYTLSDGTGRYAGISGSGRFITSGRIVFPRTAHGTCASSHPLAFQGIITLHGPVTLGK